ncbi:MAG: hypothetical protein AB7S78_12340 [Candidatus Omnitrophota bacterium]
MATKEFEQRIKIASNLTKLGVKLFKSAPPFDGLALKPQINAYYYVKFAKHYDKLEDRIKKDIVSTLKKLIQNNIERSTLRQLVSFKKTYPKHYSTLIRFQEWIRENESPPRSKYRIIGKSDYSATKIINKFLSLNLLDFSPYSKNLGNGIISFSKKNSDVGEMLVLINRGHPGDFFSLMLGLSKPNFEIDISNFCGGTQSVFPYQTEEQLKKQLKVAMEIINYLFPKFEQCIKKALM